MHENHEEGIQETSSTNDTSSQGGQSLGIPGAIVLGSALIAASIYFGLAGLGSASPLTAAVNGGDSGTEPAQPSAPTNPTAPSAPVDVTVGDLPILGDPNAPVLIVEWSDYQCPFCKRAFDDAITKIRDQYIESGEVAFAYRDFAFLGPESNAASNAARCANEQGKFWEYHDELWEQHPGSGHGDHLTADNLKAIAADLGLNTTQFNACVDTEKYAQAVLDDTSAGRSAGVSGTPTTFVNGRIVNGAQPFSAFQAVIEDELSK